ncbi:hypothetical protein NVIRENTERO_02695 [Sodalis praecaptivus]|nr:hypothetical protein NVIRENTERO_02695 [Sodalis praecaptivus]
MKACCPALHLRLHTSLDVMNLAHNAVDVAIRYSMAPDEALDTTLLYEDSFIAVASPALGLTSQGGLLTATLIHVEDRHIPQPAPDWRHWRALYGPAQLNVHAGLRFTDETHAIQAAIAGQGVAIVSRLLAKDFLDKAILCAPFAQTLPGGRYYFVTTREKYPAPGCHGAKTLADALYGAIRRLKTAAVAPVASVALAVEDAHRVMAWYGGWFALSCRHCTAGGRLKPGKNMKDNVAKIAMCGLSATPRGSAILRSFHRRAQAGNPNHPGVTVNTCAHHRGQDYYVIRLRYRRGARADALTEPSQLGQPHRRLTRLTGAVALYLFTCAWRFF